MPTDGVGGVFDALADANRRELVMRLAARETASATELAAELPITRQGIAKHLSALREAGEDGMAAQTPTFVMRTRTW